jgi:hypothetical protein
METLYVIFYTFYAFSAITLFIIMGFNFYYVFKKKNLAKRYCVDCGKDDSAEDYTLIINGLQEKYHLCTQCEIHKNINNELNPPNIFKRYWNKLVNYFIFRPKDPKRFGRELAIIIALNVFSVGLSLLKVKYHVLFGLSVILFLIYQNLEGLIQNYYYYKTKRSK